MISGGNRLKERKSPEERLIKYKGSISVIPKGAISPMELKAPSINI